MAGARSRRPVGPILVGPVGGVVYTAPVNRYAILKWWNVWNPNLGVRTIFLYIGTELASNTALTIDCPANDSVQLEHSIVLAPGESLLAASTNALANMVLTCSGAELVP